MRPIPRLAFTTGEPAGIGVDLAVLLAQTKLDCELVYFSNCQLLQDRADILGLSIDLKPFDFNKAISTNKKHEIKIIDFSLNQPVQAKILNPQNTQFVLQTIKSATQYCLAGKFHALVTGPVHKGVINKSGINFSGHTEYLQQLSNSETVVMMLAHEKMKVALATIHLPLAKVSQAINKQSLIKIIKVLNQELKNKFAIKRPKIFVAGLNPHAGESGFIGDEEISAIIPALEFCRQNLQADLIGPLAADTLFSRQDFNDADAVLAMYHDQGLPVLKYSGFGNAVNITLGLPFIRTSVDHGTALNLAGSKKTSIESLKKAIKLALSLKYEQAPSS